MNIYISDDALKWFKKEMDIQKGEYVRFFARYGGSSPVQQGFSLGVTKEEPIDMAVKYEHEGTTFFIEERDVWYFDGHDLHVIVDDKRNELLYEYKKENSLS
ncbi:HesB/YadR/YfhF family protein [Falsibacillus albus]|uniref:FeS cluster biogenesis domain-containing protein n=1 Tax=Falsibacillus albus TaxID=2478915 RepID=A0A3L7K631_9BACI|nr:HesB/YadR/YfhF family protein [Falsibacillus albus]RLQ96162.1 hypothetical protein D9X91_07680 [Falsibacillus albus]